MTTPWPEGQPRWRVVGVDPLPPPRTWCWVVTEDSCLFVEWFDMDGQWCDPTYMPSAERASRAASITHWFPVPVPQIMPALH
jgi:hypothetical protein